MLRPLQLTAASYRAKFTSLIRTNNHLPFSTSFGHPDTTETSSSNKQDGPSNTGPRMLLRDFIHNSLYHPTLGYFNRPYPVVGHLPEPIDYWKVSNADEWKRLVSKKYQELGTAWLTPAEMFSPWYGACLARHITEHRKHNLGQGTRPLEIIEVGGGNGTLAKDILDWLRTNAPNQYKTCSYTSLEISSRLAATQYNTVVDKAGHTGRFRVVQGNAYDAATWGHQTNFGHCFILMMEVLDNLPHDRVFRRSPDQAWQQAVVTLDTSLPTTQPQNSHSTSSQSLDSQDTPGCSQNDQVRGTSNLVSNSSSSSSSSGVSIQEFSGGPWREEYIDMTDPLIRRALLSTYQPLSLEQKMDIKFNKVLDWLLAKDPDPEPILGAGELLYVPTACLALLDVIHAMRPNHSLIAADFDMLPQVKLPGRNAPLVSEKINGVNKDHDTLLIPWGDADIFFPTDFTALTRLYVAAAEHIWGDKSSGRKAYAHYQQGAVMKRYREMEKTATLFSFNPMVNDFQNARFFLGDSYGKKASEVPARMPPPVHMAGGFLGDKASVYETTTIDTTSTSISTTPSISSNHIAAESKRDTGIAGAVTSQQIGDITDTQQKDTMSTTQESQQPRTSKVSEVDSEDKHIDFSWQYGYGKGMQHASLQPRTGLASLFNRRKSPLNSKPQVGGSSSGGGNSAGSAGTSKTPSSPIGPKQKKSITSSRPLEPVIGGAHLRKQKQGQSPDK